MEDKDNHSTTITDIEDQIVLSEKVKIKLKVIMKKIFLSYENELIDVMSPMDFCVIIDTLKQDIIPK